MTDDDVQTTIDGSMEAENGEKSEAMEASDQVLEAVLPEIDPSSSQVVKETTISKEFQDHFTKGVAFSPDGLCLLSNSDDNCARIFEVASPEKSVLQIRPGGTIYDMKWYPYMNSQNPATCCFATATQSHPVQLWDAYTGQLRATYRLYNHLDEVDPALSVAFTSKGDQLLTGHAGMIGVYYLDRPSDRAVVRKLRTSRKSKFGQGGIISSIHSNPDHSGIYAAGSYDGSTCIYLESSGEELMQLRNKDHASHGITQVQFTPDGQYLLTGARKSCSFIDCWDIRKTTEVLFRFEREIVTNQRIEFDVHNSGRYLITGSHNCEALVFDLKTGELAQTIDNLPDAVNGVSFAPPESWNLDYVVALGTGQRHFHLPMDDDENADEGVVRNLIQLCRISKR